MLQEVNELLSKVRAQIIELVLSSAVSSRLPTDPEAAAQTCPLMWNTLSWSRTEWVKFGGQWLHATVPALGACAADSTSTTATLLAKAQSELVATQNCIENGILRIDFDTVTGAIRSIFDKEYDREVLDCAQNARVNGMAVYVDDGDAWDFPMDYADQDPRYMELAEFRTRLDGPAVTVLLKYTLGQHTTLHQRVQLVAGSRRIDFHTNANWREPQSMLRTAFPVAVHTETARFEIQFGSIERPTHTNTTWDLAKSEVPAQKWADLSQRDYGVALMNDCKYGYKVKGNVLDLNLLRSVPYPRQPLEPPDSERLAGAPCFGFTDQCTHDFTYSLYPHPGDFVFGGVAREAYALNMPLVVFGAVPLAYSAETLLDFCKLDSPDVVVEAVKAAEDGSGDVVLRIYESAGARVNCTLKFEPHCYTIESVTETDLMEIPLPENCLLESSTMGELRLVFGPFEIKTLRVKMQATHATRQFKL